MTEQPVPKPDPVLITELSVFMFDTHTETEVDYRMEGTRYKEISKRLYAEARRFERLDRDEQKKNRQDRKTK